MNASTVQQASVEAPPALPYASSTTLDAATSVVDRLVNAEMGKLTQWISPASVLGAYADWYVHLVMAPGKRQKLADEALHALGVLALYAAAAPRSHPDALIEPLPQDKRFDAPEWQQWPFNVIYQSFLSSQRWWHHATEDVRGVTRHHERVVTFLTRQWLDMFSPSNWLLSNPQVLRATLEQGGMNLARGAQYWWHDLVRQFTGEGPEGIEQFLPGQSIACTPGKVVYRNGLVELIQYDAQTPTVLRNPVLITPSWILKYYILDLSAGNSLVRYLVERGHTVFMISWRNPTSGDRELGMDDYLQTGLLQSLGVVSEICPSAPINAVGYCLGGTLLSMAAALLARRGDTPLQSLSLIASEIDFSEPGELGLFIDESQLAYIEDIMWEQGYLDGKQMLGAFAVLNSRDLLWSRMVRDYLMGERAPLTDLAAWNADATRMPYRQHREYLERLYLNNDLAQDRYEIDGRPIALDDIHLPVFALGTVRDTVSPWRSVYKVHHLLPGTDVTFCLTSGGHNVGVVNPPDGDGRKSYRIALRQAGAHYVDPDTWLARAEVHSGSWWPAWQDWLRARSGDEIAPRAAGAPGAGYPVLGDAPGTYVHGR